MTVVAALSSGAVVLGAFLAIAGGQPAAAAEKTPMQPQQHHQRTETRARPAVPSLGRQPQGRQQGARHETGRREGARREGERREGEQGHFGYRGTPAMPGVPAAVPAIIGGLLGGLMAQPQPAAPPGYGTLAPPRPVGPPGYWYYCDAAGQYYPYVATCASGWRGVRPQ